MIGVKWKVPHGKNKAFVQLEKSSWADKQTNYTPPRHTLVAGYYVFMLAVHVSIHPHFIFVR